MMRTFGDGLLGRADWGRPTGLALRMPRPAGHVRAGIIAVDIPCRVP